MKNLFILNTRERKEKVAERMLSERGRDVKKKEIKVEGGGCGLSQYDVTKLACINLFFLYTHNKVLKWRGSTSVLIDNQA